MLYWWPKIKTLGIPVPMTKIVTSPLDIKKAAEAIGYPVFIRTDLCSGKHDWSSSCFVDSSEKINNNYLKVLENNVRWEMLGIKPEAIVVREFLELETAFTAFAGNMPINKERRYFINQGKTSCHHPYWPETAFNRHPARMANDVDWKDKLRQLNYEDAKEVDLLITYANTVASILPEFWSIDFAKAKNGKWYLLDMALGENSYHWPGCMEEVQGL